MSRSPEQPYPIYPSFAVQVGLEGALLLGTLLQLADRVGDREPDGNWRLQLPAARFTQLISFWSEAQHRQVANRLIQQGWLRQTNQSGLLELRLITGGEFGSTSVADTEPVEPMAQVATQTRPQVVEKLPIIDTPTVTSPARPPVTRSAAAPGAFGGSMGWRRNKDELERLFEAREERDQHLQPMKMGWTPSAPFYQMLRKQNIPDSFANDCLDEFVLYWMEKDRKESNWDQKFLAWVKRQWVRAQAQQANAAGQQEQRSGYADEESRRDSRENRKRVTAAIMDIRDTDW